MSDGSTQLQEALIAALTYALAPNEVFDHRPQTVPAQNSPAWVLVDQALTDWSTKDTEGTEQVIEIEIHSGYRGKKEVRRLRGIVYDTLHHQSLTLAGDFEVVLMQFMDADASIEADGLTYRGTMRLRVLLNYNPP